MSRFLPFLTAALLVCLPTLPVQAQFRGQKPQIIQVADRVYCATGYALGNVIFVVTDKSLVVVDTTESPLSASDILADFRKTSDLPVSHIIYTHVHGDHVNGAQSFVQPGTKIIAQALHVEEASEYARVRMYNRRVNAAQFGASLRERDREVAIALDPRMPILGYVEPDITFDKEYQFEEGGVQFELVHAPGETRDHLFVWLPQTRTLLAGDLFFWTFPMLSSPMKPDRPVLAWAESLEKMRERKPAHLIPSHLAPLDGEEAIDETLANYSQAIRHVHDETVRLLEEGLPLAEIRQQVTLPKELAELPYLAPLYGRVAWAVNGIYRHYTGWYDFNPANLNPGPPDRLARAVIETAGGAGPLVSRAQQALDAGDPQLALELADLVLKGLADDPAALAVRAAALAKLAEKSSNAVERNIYNAAAQAP